MTTGNTVEVWHAITIDHRSLWETKDRKLTEDVIIEIAGKEYDCNLTKKDIGEMRNYFGRYLQKYKMIL